MDTMYCSSRLTWQREGFGVWGGFFFPQIRCILPKEGDFKLQQKQRNHTYVCGVEGGWKETEYVENTLFKKQQ